MPKDIFYLLKGDYILLSLSPVRLPDWEQTFSGKSGMRWEYIGDYTKQPKDPHVRPYLIGAWGGVGGWILAIFPCAPHVYNKMVPIFTPQLPLKNQ